MKLFIVQIYHHLNATTKNHASQNGGLWLVRSIIIIITPKYHYIILLYNAPLDYINIRSLGHSRLLGSRAHPYHPEPLTLNKDVSKRSINIMRSYLALEKKVIVDGSKIPQIVPVNRVEEPSMLKKLWEIGGSAMKLILISILIPLVLPRVGS